MTVSVGVWIYLESDYGVCRCMDLYLESDDGARRCIDLPDVR